MNTLHTAYTRLPLPGQVALLGLAAAVLAALVAQALAPLPGPVGLWMALGGALATAAALWPADRSRRAQRQLGEAARALTDTALPDGQTLPPVAPNAETDELARQLRRLLELAQQQRAELRALATQLGAQLENRTQQLSTLQDLSTGLARHTEMGALVSEALHALHQTMDYSSASIWARAGLDPQQPVVLMGYRSQADELAGVEPGELTGLRLSRANLQRYEQIEADGAAIVENQPRQGLLAWLWAMVTDDARTSALYRSTRAWMAVPLKVRDRVLGVLRVDHGTPAYFDAERERLLHAVGSQTALAMRHARLLEQERDVAVVAERNRIARDLHDAVSQTLFAANLLAGTLARDDGLSEAARGQVQTLERLNRSALAEMRMMLFELRPDALEGVRLPELLQHAIEALAGRGGVDVTSEIAAEPAPPARHRIEIYRIAQEALSNIGRHSGARHVHVGWTVQAPGQGRLHIVDDGCGFDPQAAKPGHFGLENMHQRAAAIGGTLSLESAVGEGTELRLDVAWN